MTAKEMFKDLDYDCYEDDGITCYLLAECIPDRLDTEYIKFQEIGFHRLSQEITIHKFRKNAKCTKFINSKMNNTIFLSKEELQAINKQVEELGWLDEN